MDHQPVGIIGEQRYFDDIRLFLQAQFWHNQLPIIINADGIAIDDAIIHKSYFGGIGVYDVAVWQGNRAAGEVIAAYERVFINRFYEIDTGAGLRGGGFGAVDTAGFCIRSPGLIRTASNAGCAGSWGVGRADGSNTTRNGPARSSNSAGSIGAGGWFIGC